MQYFLLCQIALGIILVLFVYKEIFCATTFIMHFINTAVNSVALNFVRWMKIWSSVLVMKSWRDIIAFRGSPPLSAPELHADVRLRRAPLWVVCTSLTRLLRIIYFGAYVYVQMLNEMEIRDGVSSKVLVSGKAVLWHASDVWCRLVRLH